MTTSLEARQNAIGARFAAETYWTGLVHCRVHIYTIVIIINCIIVLRYTSLGFSTYVDTVRIRIILGLFMFLCPSLCPSLFHHFPLCFSILPLFLSGSSCWPRLKRPFGPVTARRVVMPCLRSFFTDIDDTAINFRPTSVFLFFVCHLLCPFRQFRPLLVGKRLALMLK